MPYSKILLCRTGPPEANIPSRLSYASFLEYNSLPKTSASIFCFGSGVSILRSLQRQDQNQVRNCPE